MTFEETVARISSNLRKMGRRVGIEESIDAANALKLLGPSVSGLFQAAIKATLIKDFDLSSERERNERSKDNVRYGIQDQRIGKDFTYRDMSEQERHSHKDSHNFEFGLYSPLAIETKQKMLEISRFEEKKWLIAISKLKNSILTLKGHRFRRSDQGRIDLRRSMWLELKKAGESPIVYRSERKISKANVVLLCDISGSMRESNSTIVNMCSSFKKAIPKSEIFLFSTRLKRITHYASKYSARELALRIPKLDLGFGGGTKIGECLRQFRLIYGSLLTRKTTVLIFSDGWDIGDISVLKSEMKELQRRTYRVIWINPYLDSKDYSVETIGMKTALEYSDSFLSPKELLNGFEIFDAQWKRTKNSDQFKQSRG